MRCRVVAKSPSTGGLRVLVEFRADSGRKREERFLFPSGTSRTQVLQQFRVRGAELEAAWSDAAALNLTVGEEFTNG
jgi:hypothetical protein